MASTHDPLQCRFRTSGVTASQHDLPAFASTGNAADNRRLPPARGEPDPQEPDPLLEFRRVSHPHE
jgi:hypothetical protein